MVAITKLFGTEPQRQEPSTETHSNREPRGLAIAKLKSLHAEAEETARLANLLGRSLYAGIAMPVLAIVTVALSVEMSPAPQLVWIGFVALIAVAVLMSYRHAMRQPFERATLKNFAKDLSATLLFAGFAWGSGAFLALPTGAPAVAVLGFALLPSVLIAYLLRDREALFLFLAPVTTLSAAACLLKPFAGDIELAGVVLAAAAGLGGAVAVFDRLTSGKSKPAMLSLP